MYTILEAEFLKEYYFDKIIGQCIGSVDKFIDIRLNPNGSKFDVLCFITTSAYAHLEKAAKDLNLIQPEEVLRELKK